MDRHGAYRWFLLALPSQLACTGFIDGPDGGPPGGAAIAGAGGSAASPNPGLPEQPLDTLRCEQRVAPVGRVQRLTPTQYQSTLLLAYQHEVNLAALPKDGVNQVTGFNNDAGTSYVTVPLADAVFDHAQAIAATQGDSALATRPCLDETPDDACLDAFLNEHALRAFRRPLETEEAARYRQFYRDQVLAYDTAAARRMTLEAMLNAPGLLYRTELGSGAKGEVTLSGYETASELAYSLSDAPPDESLLAAASSGELSDPARVRVYAQALLDSPAGKQKLSSFFVQYLGLGNLELGGVEAAMSEAMLQESASFTESVVWGPSGNLRELFTASYTFIDQRLAPLYGVALSAVGTQRVELAPDQRAGIFTQLGFLASRHGPIHRGRVLKEGLLCGTIPAPPPGASAQTARLAGPDPDATEQQRWATFRQEPGCGGCHATFQPLGIAFDGYDELGRYRLQNEAGRAIDASGEFLDAGELSGSFADAKDLLSQIVESSTGRYCFAKRYMSFAHAREVNTSADACALKAVGEKFVESQLSIRELMFAVTADDSFSRRNNVE